MFRPRPARRMPRSLPSLTRLAPIACICLAAHLVRAEDVLLDLPEPRPEAVEPAADALTAPEAVVRPPARPSAPATPRTDPNKTDPNKTGQNKTGKGKSGKNKSGAAKGGTPKAGAGAVSAKTDGKSEGKGEKKKPETNDCCGRPGMIPVCRCVPVTKKKSHTEYDTKCELVCVPGCGLLHDCHLAGHGAGQGVGCCDEGCPSCADVRIRQRYTLQKRVTEKEYDTYEFKIEWVPACCAFGGCTGCASARPERHALLDWLPSFE